MPPPRARKKVVGGRNERGAKHGAVIEASLAIRRNRLADTIGSRAYRNGSRVSVAKFELGEGDEPEQREARAWSVMPSQHFCRTGRVLLHWGSEPRIRALFDQKGVE
jgi:hypothetical protein